MFEIASPMTVLLFLYVFFLIFSFLFWKSGSSVSVIERSRLNGTNVTSVIEMKGELKALTLDTHDKRIYWVRSELDAAESSLGTCTYNGESVTVIKHLAM